VAERMADYFVRDHAAMPGSGKTAEAVNAARCLEDSAHASVMTSVPRPGKATAAATGLRSYYPCKVVATKLIANRLRTCRRRSWTPARRLATFLG
jgi:hypothetical protein